MRDTTSLSDIAVQFEKFALEQVRYQTGREKKDAEIRKQIWMQAASYIRDIMAKSGQ